jgi:cytoskeleton protein RodZ
VFDTVAVAFYHKARRRFVLCSDKDAMGDLGERLKREREAKGVSLSEIAEKTRIGVRLLKAIEEEAFDQLPGGIFNKSFIEQYAQYLGVDEKQAVRDYLRATAASREPENPPPLPEPKTLSLFRSSGFPLRLSLGVVAIVLAALVIRLAVPGSNAPREAAPSVTPPPSTSASSEVAEAEDESGALPAVPEATEESEEIVDSEFAAPVLEAADDQSVRPSPAELLMNAEAREPLEGELPEELLLQISARSTVWISVTADGETEWQGLMEANQSREVQAADTIRLTVGNAAGVDLTLNGKELGSLGNEGEVKTVTLAARALQEVVP